MIPHECIKDVFICETGEFSSCLCTELLLEQVTFFLQDSGASTDMLRFVEEFERQADVKDAIHGPIDSTDNLLDILQSFLKLLKALDLKVAEFFDSLFRPAQFQQTQSIFDFEQQVQSVVSSVVFPLDLRNRLKTVFEAYLSLELEASESEVDAYNVFSSVISAQPDDKKTQILRLGRTVKDSGRFFSLDSFYQTICIPFAKASLTYRVKALCSENYSEHFLEPILEYKEFVMKQNWIARLFSRPALSQKIGAQLSDEVVYRIFYDVRKTDIFSLIIEFPDSVAALLDLGKCLDHVSFRQDLIAHLTKEVKQRLLHPGVHTEQILVAYSYLVRALRLVDSSFLAQDIVCRPVSLCLRQREDAVRCIVDKLISAPDQDKDEGDPKATDEQVGTSTELHSELLLPKPLEVEPADGAEDSDADVVAEDPPFDFDLQATSRSDGSSTDSNACWGSNWQPDPVEAMYQNGLWRRRMDLLSMLVSIYGSKKAFLVEYRQLLSQRLLRQHSFHTARELRNLELLKLRFGEQNLHECEVMLKDIRDSKRIAASMSENMPKSSGSSRAPPIRPSRTDNNGSIGRPKSGDQCPADSSQSPESFFPLCVFILSRHYWPELLDDHFKLPGGLKGPFEDYKSSFQRLKGNRTLCWMHKLGLVNVDLELGNRKLQLDITPLQASIMHLFTQKRSWSLRDLAQELETSISNIRHALQTFIQLGFLRSRPTSPSSLLRDDNGQPDTKASRPESSAECFELVDAASDTLNETSQNRMSSATSVPGLCSSGAWFYPGQIDGVDGESIVSSVRERKEKELHVFWSYIVAMLTNLGGLSLDRIHSMLRMFALGSTSSLECNRDELRQFLDKKIRESELTFDGDVYKLSKPDA